jgi:hypothetical protein
MSQRQQYLREQVPKDMNIHCIPDESSNNSVGQWKGGRLRKALECQGFLSLQATPLMLHDH